jgi:cysteinyl-tRNA synthetase
MIRIYNSLTGEKEALTPIKPGHIGMYVCGITVYDYIHIGHARMLTVFDTVQRYLRHRGFEVQYVRNITDIDDKIIRRAAERGQAIEQVTEHFIKAMNEDCEALGLQRPDVEPRATQYIGQIVAMIEQLIAREYAYVAPNGDVMYAVAHFDGYGKLSGKRLADLRAGARVEVDEAKRDPLDFVLWKSAKPGEPAWDSPWGKGRPGWHIECSAMSTAVLGQPFDIHGGGIDLKFPHHENEIAQTCGATGAKFVNVWMHNGFVNVDDEKMSKSLGNFFTVREVLPKLRHPEVMRYFLLASQYRGPINYSMESLEQADIQVNRIYTALRDLPTYVSASQGEYTRRFYAAMDDDFNTPEALAVLQTLTREINSARDITKHRLAAEHGTELRTLAGLLGLGQLNPEKWFQSSGLASTSGKGESTSAPAANGSSGDNATLSNDEVQRLVDARAAARVARDWAESDRLRDALAAAGIIVEDKPGGKATWRRK